jgi:hypothetical protein
LTELLKSHGRIASALDRATHVDVPSRHAQEEPPGGGALHHASPNTPTLRERTLRKRRETFALAEAHKIRTPEDFAIVLLTYMGFPINRTNVKALLQWESSEGVFPVHSSKLSGYHNPLATGFLYEGKGPKTPDSRRPNLQAAEYPSWKVGIEATAFSLREHQYSGILNVLRHSEGGHALETQVHREKWGTGPWSTSPLAPYTYTSYKKSEFLFRGSD